MLNEQPQKYTHPCLKVFSCPFNLLSHTLHVKG